MQHADDLQITSAEGQGNELPGCKATLQVCSKQSRSLAERRAQDRRAAPHLCSARFALLHFGSLRLHALLQPPQALLLLPIWQPVQQACNRCQA